MNGGLVAALLFNAVLLLAVAQAFELVSERLRLRALARRQWGVGILLGAHLASLSKGSQMMPPPRASAYGSLLTHLQEEVDRDFAPMNINWGLFPDPELPPKAKTERKAKKLENARSAFEEWISGLP